MVDRDAPCRGEGVDAGTRGVDVVGDLVGAAQPTVLLGLIAALGEQLGSPLGYGLDQLSGNVEGQRA